MTRAATQQHTQARANPTSPLGGFLLLFAVLYSAFGVASPFFPAFIESRGVSPEQIGILLAAGTAIRLVSAPIAGRLADRFHALRLMLAICALTTAAAAASYLPAWGFWALLAVSLFHSFALAPTTNLADALALMAAKGGPHQGFEYGWARGAGSAAFIVGSLVAGAAVAFYGLAVILWLQVLLMLAVPLATRLVPEPTTTPADRDEISRAGVMTLVRMPVFRRVVLVAALILGSHAMHDAFAVIRWTAAGVSAQTVSLLWSLSVAAEVVVFLLIGPWLLRRLTPAGAIAFAACAGAVRWLVTSLTADIFALSLTQPLHGFTFALLHLACMRVLTRNVPPELAATAQAIYGTVGIGIATALLTLASGWLYGRMGAPAFVAMSLLCLAALPVAASLRRTA